jgi:hypothetical protein
MMKSQSCILRHESGDESLHHHHHHHHHHDALMHAIFHPFDPLVVASAWAEPDETGEA